jgi:hypothetical protein
MHEYAYSLPVAALVSGCISPAEVAKNTACLRDFTGMDEAERKRLLALSAKHAGAAIESYKSAPASG